jgi:hypothetical protein
MIKNIVDSEQINVPFIPKSLFTKSYNNNKNQYNLENTNIMTFHYLQNDINDNFMKIITDKENLFLSKHFPNLGKNDTLPFSLKTNLIENKFDFRFCENLKICNGEHELNLMEYKDIMTDFDVQLNLSIKLYIVSYTTKEKIHICIRSRIDQINITKLTNKLFDKFQIQPDKKQEIYQPPEYINKYPTNKKKAIHNILQFVKVRNNT